MHDQLVDVSFQLRCTCGFASNEFQEPPFERADPDNDKLISSCVFAYVWRKGIVHRLPLVMDLGDPDPEGFLRAGIRLVHGRYGSHAECLIPSFHFSQVHACPACRKRNARMHVVGPDSGDPVEMTDEEVEDRVRGMEDACEGDLDEVRGREFARFLLRAPDKRVLDRIRALLSEEAYLSLENYLIECDAGLVTIIGNRLYTSRQVQRATALLWGEPGPRTG